MNSGAHTSGSFAEIQTVSVKDGGTWKTGTAYVKDGGTWKAWLVGAGGGGPGPGGSVAISDQSPYTYNITPTSSTAEYSLKNDGVAQYIDSVGTTPISGEWLVSGSAADFEVRATATSGTLTYGTTGSWESLGTTRAWGVTRTTIGIKSCTLTIEIRRASDGVVLDSATITLSAEVDT